MKSSICRVLIFLLAGMFFIIPATPQLSEPETQELEKKLQQATGKGKEEIQVLALLIKHYRNRSPEKCIALANRLLNLAPAVDYPSEVGQVLLTKGDALSMLSRREEALQCRTEALDLFHRHQDRQGIAAALNAIGNHYRSIGYYHVALKYHLDALQIIEKSANETEMITSYWHLGNLYIQLEDYYKSLTYFQKALTLIDKRGETSRKPYFLHNIGLVYFELGNPGKALEYLHLSLTIFEKTQDSFWIAATLDNIGMIQGKNGHPTKGLKSLLRSKQIQETTDSKKVDFYTLFYIGEIYDQTGDYTAAQSYFDQAFTIANEIKDKKYLSLVYLGYANLSAHKENYRAAYYYFQNYHSSEKELLDIEKNKQIAELEVSFDVERKQRQILLLENENHLRISERNVLILGLILIFIIFAFLFKKYLYLFAFWKKEKYISQYRIIKRIGSGGVGTVFQAQPVREKHQTVAVKILKEEMAENEINRQRFKREGTIIDHLNHPNIIKIYERGESNGKYFIAMEFLDGRTLDQVISQDGALPQAKTFKIMKQTIDALAFIHEKKILHRDIKPSNIMLLDKPGSPLQIKLLDFGMAMMKFQTRLTQSGSLVGSIQYIAPEQITDGICSFPSDIYSLGITFYEMLIGKPVFSDESITTIVEKILDTRPIELFNFGLAVTQNTPQEIKELILKMVNKSPSLRPTAMEILTTLKQQEEPKDIVG